MKKGVNIMETLGTIDFGRKFGAMGNATAVTEKGLAQTAYRDDCIDAQYCQGA